MVFIPLSGRQPKWLRTRQAYARATASPRWSRRSLRHWLCAHAARKRTYVSQGHTDLLREHAFSVVEHHQAPPAGRVQRYQLELAPPPPELPPPEEDEPPLEPLDDEEEEEEDEEVDVRLA